MDTKTYRTNRTQFPRTALGRHRGQWVAFSADGRSLLACDEELERLGEILTSQGQDLQQVVFEYVSGPEDDSLLDRAESV
jgi:hypothetical protein